MAMLRNLSFAVLLAACTAPALACQPPLAGAELTDAEVSREAANQIRRSDAIIDATVVRWLDGEVVLQALHVWKGPKQRHWRVIDPRCGTAFPLPGEKLRVLLQREESGIWYPLDPSMGGRIDYPVRMDRAIDRRLGSPRPKGFVSIVEAVPPPPPTKP